MEEKCQPTGKKIIVGRLLIELLVLSCWLLILFWMYWWVSLLLLHGQVWNPHPDWLNRCLVLCGVPMMALYTIIGVLGLSSALQHKRRPDVTAAVSRQASLDKPSLINGKNILFFSLANVYPILLLSAALRASRALAPDGAAVMSPIFVLLPPGQFLALYLDVLRQTF